MKNIDEKVIGTKLLYAFPGKESLPDYMKDAILKGIAGVTLFRYLNVDSPAQVRRLTSGMQACAKEAGQPPLLIAADQEGGQLMAINGTTPLPGNMALGATGSAELAYQAGKVLATELAAMGVNVNYAPSLDVNNNPDNPVIGVRSFGADAQMVAKLGVALIKGLQDHGVVACAKHFPGHGDTDGDSHHMLPSVNHDRKRLDAVEFPPFLEAFRQDVQMVMTAHLALPAVEGNADVPATLSYKLLTEMLRDTLHYEGVIITDAMEMKAIRQGHGLPVESMAAFRAGADILLMGPTRNDLDAVFEATLLAAQRGFLDVDALEKSANRVWAMRKRFQDFDQPALSVLQCEAHMKVANEIAEKSITLLRDDANLLPLKLNSDQRIVVLLPKPEDLTPADTSSYVNLSLKEKMIAEHYNVFELQYTMQPDEDEINAVLQQIRGDDLVLVGTINARQHSGQVHLLEKALQIVGGRQLISVALRLPDDLAFFPEVETSLCTYSILEPSLHALADILFGRLQAVGRLPVPVGNLYPIGYGK